MALRCSLTGHAWGDVRTEVDRDEGLDEVAITQVEYRECERCGEVDVLSENTEVTAMASEEDATDDAEADAGAEDGAAEGEERHVATGDDAVIIDAEVGRAESDDGDDDEPEDPGYVGTGAGGSAPAADGSYRCPDCGFQEGAAESSHRPGDLCPRCRDGYLEEQD